MAALRGPVQPALSKYVEAPNRTDFSAQIYVDARVCSNIGWQTSAGRASRRSAAFGKATDEDNFWCGTGESGFGEPGDGRGVYELCAPSTVAGLSAGDWWAAQCGRRNNVFGGASVRGQPDLPVSPRTGDVPRGQVPARV